MSKPSKKNRNGGAVATSAGLDTAPVEVAPSMILLPAPKGKCQECAVDHELEQPHSQESLHYQYHFYGRHGRWPTWADALAHCPPDIKEFWTAELASLGVSV